MEQYIRDKYEHKLFMNSGNRTSSIASSSSIPSGNHSTIGATRITSTYAKELSQLQEMGFQDRNKCLNALQSTNGNIMDSIDKLAASKSPALTSTSTRSNILFDLKSDPYGDLIDSGFSNLSIGGQNQKNSSDVGKNDWTDMEFSRPAQATQDYSEDFSEFKTSESPKEKATSPLAASAPQSWPDEQAPNAVVTNPAAVPVPAKNPDPWGSLSSPNGLGSVLGSSSTFPDDDNDPFRELTHNPFK